MSKPKVAFICVHNSCRSQMAEGLTNYYFSNEWEGFSAGTEKTFVKPMAIKTTAGSFRTRFNSGADMISL